MDSQSKKRKYSEDLSDNEATPAIAFKYNNTANSLSKENSKTSKNKHFKSENLTDSETDHDSPVKKIHHFIEKSEASPIISSPSFRSDFEIAFHGPNEATDKLQRDEPQKDTHFGFYSYNSSKIESYNVSNETQKTVETLTDVAANQQDENSSKTKSLKRSHDDSSSANSSIGYKLMVNF